MDLYYVVLFFTDTDMLSLASLLPMNLSRGRLRFDPVIIHLPLQSFAELRCRNGHACRDHGGLE